MRLQGLNWNSKTNNIAPVHITLFILLLMSAKEAVEAEILIW